MKLTDKSWTLIDTIHGQPNAINLSSIYTLLIKEAGKCEAYSSDILIDIDSIKESIKQFDGDTKIHYIGFRNYGTDHETFIVCRNESEYRKVYMITVSPDERYDDYVQVALYDMI